ncbi:uncharacterized protein LOC135195462 [Macrobrachium nipponense]|uniref:uncharacterized protein LOC135195462 n=1 Tax=Macrobrachium nipponense TaxID=159736 RepID=UPI0030C7D555
MKCLALVVFALLGTVCLGRDANDARIVAAYSTRTAITLTTITSVQPYTCAFAVTTTPCQGRRMYRREFLGMFPEDDSLAGDDKTLLDSTFEDPLISEGRALDSADRQGRIALTVWTTSSSTYTITSTSTNFATTYSLSYYCSINGFPYPPSCG